MFAIGVSIVMRTVNVLSGTQNWYVALSQLDGFDTIVLLAVGSWQLAVGSWQLAVGSWQLAVDQAIGLGAWGHVGYLEVSW